jgi:hypothetical protein
MMIAKECPRCNGSGEIAISVRLPCKYIGPGPVPEDARGIAAAPCGKCNGTGCLEHDLSDEIEDWMR